MTPRVSWLDRTAETVRALLTDMASDPNGQYEPCVYETGRLVTLAPSLPHHRERVDFLLRTQREDGHWGGPGEYDVVTTLSATEALLTERGRPGADPEVGRAADRGVEALSRRLALAGALPDTVAVELVVPALLSEINAHLTRLGRTPLPEPPGTRPDLLDAIRDALAQGHDLPEKLWHSLELFGPAARGAVPATTRRSHERGEPTRARPGPPAFPSRLRAPRAGHRTVARAARGGWPVEPDVLRRRRHPSVGGPPPASGPRPAHSPRHGP